MSEDFMSEDYDRLSELGEEQSRKLAAFWVKHEIVFDACFCGPARRHTSTAEIAGQAVRDAGLAWPKVEILPELDEFDAFRVARVLTPVLVQSDPEIQRLNEIFRAAENTPDAGRHLQKLFEAVSRKWCSGAHDIPELESWPQFQQRVRTAIDNIRQASGRGQNIAVFTSAGVIAVTMSRVLDLEPKHGVEFVWLTRNGSFSEFLYSGARFSMHSYNSVPHFDDKLLLTYR